MALQKHFLKPSLEKIGIPKWQILGAAMISLAFAYVFFLFLLFIKEGIWVANFFLEDSLYRGYLIPNARTNFIVHFGLAIVSLLLGSSIFIQFIFSRRGNNFLKKQVANRKRISIVNDSRYAFYYQIGVVFKLVTLLSIIYVAIFLLFIAFEYNPKLVLMLYISAIIMPFTLYYHQWNTIQRTFSNYKKWMHGGLVLIIVLSLVFASFYPNVVKRVHLVAKNQSYIHRYSLDIPLLKNVEKLERRSLSFPCVLAYPSDKKVEKPQMLVLHGNVIPLNKEQFTDAIIAGRSDLAEEDRGLMTCHLAIGPDVEMKYVDYWQKGLRKAGVLRIGYFSKLGPLSSSQLLNEKLRLYCPIVDEELVPFSQVKKEIETSDNFLNMGCDWEYRIEHFNRIYKDIKTLYVYLTEEELIVNNQKTTIEEFSQQLNNIPKDQLHNMVIHYDKDVLFGDFVKIKDLIRGTKRRILNEIAIEKYNTDYMDLYRYEVDQVNKELKFYNETFNTSEWKYFEYLEKSNEIKTE